MYRIISNDIAFPYFELSRWSCMVLVVNFLVSNILQCTFPDQERVLSVVVLCLVLNILVVGYVDCKYSAMYRKWIHRIAFLCDGCKTKGERFDQL